MNYLRERVLEPILIPLVALALIAFGALNLSRLFLASASADRAVIVATLVAAAILATAAWATSRDEPLDRGTMLAGAALVGLVLSGAGLLAAQVDRDHLAHEGGGEVAAAGEFAVEASNFRFNPPDHTTAGPGIEITLNTVGGSHTFVVEGREADLKLAAGEGATDAGIIELEPGGYTFYCDVAGHRDAGMEGALTVS